VPVLSDLLTEQNIMLLVYCGIAVGVLLAFTAMSSFLSNRETVGEIRSRRMRMIREGRSIEERLTLLKPPSAEDRTGQPDFMRKLVVLLRRAGLSLGAGSFIGICALLSAAIFGVLLLSPVPVVLVVVAALAAGFGLPITALRIKVDRQTKALIAQLPDALELMARGLRVGHPLNTSIGAVAQEMADPIGSEFGIIYDQVNYGDDLPEAFHDFAERVDLEDVHYLSASIGIQHGTGSDLSRVVELLAKVIRGRIMMRRKIRAISSEGRASAWILSAIPVLIFIFTTIASPTYYGGVYDEPLFVPMASAVVILTVLNALILRRLVNFHV